jgi:hypothetical protein
MRKMVVNLLAIALVVTGGRGAHGQQPTTSEKNAPESKPTSTKSKLEDLLAQALKDNPDIRVATAKLSEAEAELNRVRLQVLQKVITLQRALERAQEDVQTRQKEFERKSELVTKNLLARPFRDEAQASLEQAKIKLAEVEGELPYLLGKQPQSKGPVPLAIDFGFPQLQRAEAGLKAVDYNLTYQRTLQAWTKTKLAEGPMADKIRQALDKPISASYKEAPFDAVLGDLKKSNPGIHFQISMASGSLAPPVSIQFESLPLGAVLQWLEDMLPGHRVVVREYGLLITSQERIPPGALLLDDFWKRGKPEEKAKPGETDKKNPPANPVEGQITQTDPSGLVRLSIGTDAGLVKGQTLEVYRLNPEAKYLGTIRILEARPGEAVGQTSGRMSDVVKKGDRVSSQIVGH